MFVDLKSDNMSMISSRDLMSHMMYVVMEEAGLVSVPQTFVQT